MQAQSPQPWKAQNVPRQGKRDADEDGGADRQSRVQNSALHESVVQNKTLQ